ncbi:uncharacterized [Tachysurus ichikawai]
MTGGSQHREQQPEPGQEASRKCPGSGPNPGAGQRNETLRDLSHRAERRTDGEECVFFYGNMSHSHTCCCHTYRFPFTLPDAS